jgi:acyl dehydratase
MAISVISPAYEPDRQNSARNPTNSPVFQQMGDCVEIAQRLHLLRAACDAAITPRGAGVKVFKDLNEFAAAQGSQLGPTEWMEISQDRVNLFADATDDHQWIHVDPEKAADGPFGGTIAHGLLTLSLLPHFSHDLYRVDGISLAVNYGYNKVRFITPVKVGARIRARGEVTAINQLESAVQATTTITVEIEDSEKPAAVAESIIRYIA